MPIRFHRRGALLGVTPFLQSCPSCVLVGGMVTTILLVSAFNLPNEYLLLTTEKGGGSKRRLWQPLKNLSSRGLILAKLDSGDRMRWCQRCRDGDDVLVGWSMGMGNVLFGRQVAVNGAQQSGRAGHETARW